MENNEENNRIVSTVSNRINLSFQNIHVEKMKHFGMIVVLVFLLFQFLQYSYACVSHFFGLKIFII